MELGGAEERGKKPHARRMVPHCLRPLVRWVTCLFSSRRIGDRLTKTCNSKPRKIMQGRSLYLFRAAEANRGYGRGSAPRKRQRRRPRRFLIMTPCVSCEADPSRDPSRDRRHRGCRPAGRPASDFSRERGLLDSAATALQRLGGTQPALG